MTVIQIVDLEGVDDQVEGDLPPLLDGLLPAFVGHLTPQNAQVKFRDVVDRLRLEHPIVDALDENVQKWGVLFIDTNRYRRRDAHVGVAAYWRTVPVMNQERS